MLQTKRKGLRIIFNLNSAERQKMDSLFEMLTDVTKRLAHAGNIEIKRRSLCPSNNESHKGILREMLKDLADKYFSEDYGIAKPKQYSTMLTDNLIKTFETRKKRHDREYNFFDKNVNLNSIMFDANKVKVQFKGALEFTDRGDITFVNNTTLKFHLPFDERISLNFFVPTRQKDLVTNSDFTREDDRRGGWVTRRYDKKSKCNKYFMTILVVHEYDTVYIPEGTLSFDFNKRKDVFLVFSDGTKIGRDESMEFLIKENNDVNKEFRKSQGKDSSRNRALNIKRIEMHKLLKQRMSTLVNDIIHNKVIPNKLLVAIDDLTDKKNTSFGQYEFKEILIKELIRLKIPFVLVPTPFTSKICSYCSDFVNGKFYLVERPSPEIMRCTNCGKVCDADENAANNIAIDGEYLFYNGWLETEKPSHKQKELLKQMSGLDNVGNIPLIWQNFSQVYRNRKMIIDGNSVLPF